VIITTAARRGSGLGGGSQKLFQFEAAWLEEEKCMEVVEAAWREAVGSGEMAVSDALKVVTSGLGQWRSNVLEIWRSG
jgi:hypothetical protein